tara:strand:- start:854 stop:1834 length:981 start_codon:yes stop_codon:yes gene_type:complete
MNFYFIFNTDNTLCDTYYHTIIAFAEGLKALNIPFYSNINYYCITDNLFLFNKTDEPFFHFDYIVINNFIDSTFNMKLLYNPNKLYKTIMIDTSKDLNSSFDIGIHCDYYFKTSYNTKLYSLHKNMYPLAYYLTNRIIDTIDNISSKIHIKQHKIFISHRINNYFRNIINQSYQTFINITTYFHDNYINPNDDNNNIHYIQTNQRHNLDYYNNLHNTLLCDTTSGDIYHNIMYNVDSIKLWEALYSGSCVICIDFDKYNIKLPYQLKNMEHYIGFTTNKTYNRELIKRIFNNEIDINKIALNGQKFVQQYYQPINLAQYIIDILQL